MFRALGGVLLAVLLLSGVARAEVRSFTLLEIRGPGGDRFARQIESDLADLYTRVPASNYYRMARQLGATGPSPGEVSRVATRIHAEVVIAGAVVDDHGPDARLLVVVRDGRTGAIAARFRFSLVGWTLPSLREKVTGALVQAFDRITPGRPAPADLLAIGAPPPKPVEPNRGVVPPPGDDDERPGEGGGRRDRPAPPVEPTPDEALVERAPPPPSTGWAARGVYAGIGPALIGRSLSFDSGAAQGYSGGAAAGLRVDGAVFPFSLTPEWASRHPVLATIGFAGMYEHVFGVTATGGPQQASTNAHGSRWQAQLLSRIPLGRDARGGILTIEFTFQELTWAFDTQAVEVPDTSLDLLGAGLGWEHTLGTRHLTFGLRAAAMGLLTAGALTTDTQYGRGGGWAVDVEGGLTARPTPWLWLRLTGRFTPTVISFAGAGARFAKQAVDMWGDGVLEVGFAL